MRKLSLLICFLLIQFALFAQRFESAHSFNGNFIEYCYSNCMDEFGNVYTVGVFFDTLFFAQLNDTLVSEGSEDVVITKHDVNGNCMWAKRFGGQGQDISSSILAKGNHIYLGGSGILNSSAFVLKLDLNGNIIWLKQFQGASAVISLSVSASEDVYLTGDFQISVDLNPDTTVNNITSSNGHYDFFTVKLDSAGNFIWGHNTGGVESDFSSTLTLNDNNNNVIEAGMFYQTVDFDPGSNTSSLTSAVTNTSNAFIRKLDSAGNFLWVKHLKESNSQNFPGIDISKVLTDKSENIYISGSFSGTFDFNPGFASHNVTATNYRGDAFILKLNSNGGFVWVKTFGGYFKEEIEDFEIDSLNKVYLVGYFKDSINYDSSSTVVNKASKGLTDGYIAMLDSLGNHLSFQSFGSLKNEEFNAIAFNNENHIMISGVHDSAFNLNNVAPYFGLPSPTNLQNNIFVAKYAMNSILTSVFNKKKRSGFLIYPNPAQKVLNVKVDGGKTFHKIQLIDLKGNTIKEKEVSLNGSVSKFNISDISSGVYIVRYGTNNKKIIISN